MIYSDDKDVDNKCEKIFHQIIKLKSYLSQYKSDGA